MSTWLTHLRAALDSGRPCVAVSVVAVRGSAPREPGACMLVMSEQVIDTIGGGNLEFTAIDRARAALSGLRELPEGGEVRRYVLGPEMGQCCGGVAFLHFEQLPAAEPGWLQRLNELRISDTDAILICRCQGGEVTRVVVSAEDSDVDGPADEHLESAIGSARSLLCAWPSGRNLLWHADDAQPTADMPADFVLMRPVLTGGFRVVLFGAGHVGRALVRVLNPLADQIVWCDSRPEEFPETRYGNVCYESGDPFKITDTQPAATCYLIMTHSHSLDMVLCDAVLRRRDYAYCGLIGSASKRKRFEKYLLEEGLEQSDLEGLTCPIGIGGIDSKHPAAIAVSVAAELLRVGERRADAMQRGATPILARPAAANK